MKGSPEGGRDGSGGAIPAIAETTPGASGERGLVQCVPWEKGRPSAFGWENRGAAASTTPAVHLREAGIFYPYGSTLAG